MKAGEAALRGRLLENHGIEVGGGLGPLAGSIWRVGLMGHNSTTANVFRFLSALESALADQHYEMRAGAGVAAAQQSVRELGV
jgi:alanine-glyoxylate transaminase/serine-glyoxylate transaminase/serine-pyruvate transaminase